MAVILVLFLLLLNSDSQWALFYLFILFYFIYFYLFIYLFIYLLFVCLFVYLFVRFLCFVLSCSLSYYYVMWLLTRTITPCWGGWSWLLCIFSLVCGLCTVFHGLFVPPFDVIGMLCSVIVAVSRHLMHYFDIVSPVWSLQHWVLFWTLSLTFLSYWSELFYLWIWTHPFMRTLV